MYLSDLGSDRTTIMKAGMDGTNQEVIINEGLSYIHGLAIGTFVFVL